MLTYSFDQTGGKALYDYLYECLKNDILAGKLEPDQKLPSKRSFAKNLGVSVITVENAYAQLIAEGYVYSLPKRGFFAARLPEFMRQEAVFMHKEAEKKAESRISSSQTQGQKSPQGSKETASACLVDFTSNQTEHGHFPFATWARISREVLSSRQEELLVNSPSEGLLPLRQAISDYLMAYRGFKTSPSQIIVGAGTDYLYGLLIQLFGTERRYGAEDPGYSKVSRIFASFNVPHDHIAMDQSGIRVDRLRELATDIVHITPSHHFPTGRIMPIGRRYELLAWAREEDGRYIIEDDYDTEFRLSGRPIPPLASIDRQEKVVYINTFTKTLASTIRISYMVLPPHLAERFRKELSFYSCSVSNFEQYTLADFIGQGYFEKHINRMRTYYHNKRDHLLKEISSCALSPYVEITEEDAGLHFIMRVRTELKDREFCRLAEERGIRIRALSEYYSSLGQTEHVFVINYSAISEESIQAAAEALYQIITKPQLS